MKHRGVFAPLETDRLRYNFYLLYCINPYLIILDSNNYSSDKYSSFNLLLASGIDCVEFTAGSYWDQLKDNYNKRKWLLGYVGYSVHNETSKTEHNSKDYTGFPEIFFFKPSVVIYQNNVELIIESDLELPDEVYSYLKLPVKECNATSFTLTDILHRTSKEKYLKTIDLIKDDIVNGIYYELNYCQEFYTERLSAEPFHLFNKMNKATVMPFASFFKIVDKFIIGCSPERFLKKKGSTLLSQPIKGTSARNIYSKTADDNNKKELQLSDKERAENVMIVDLVRNDLTRSAQIGTVQVRELCQVYSYSTVHQMISTITAQLHQDIHPIDALKNAFPMGSMTGAPKLEVMKHINKLEDTQRNVYSGCLGYINPEGDFDFNVIIRTLLYNTQTGYASYHTGSAITYDSIPQKEYEECLLKAKTFFSLLAR